MRCFDPSVRPSVVTDDISRTCLWILTKLGRWVHRMNLHKWHDFGADPVTDWDTGSLIHLSQHCEMGQISQKQVDGSRPNFVGGCTG